MSAAAGRANREQDSDASTARNRSRGTRRAALTDWRNWRIPVKLGAVVLVPIVFVLTLGAFQIHAEVSKANRYEEISRLATARDRIQPLLTGLQAERTKAAELLGGAPGAGREYRQQYEKVTGYVEQAPEVLDDVQKFSPVTSAQFDELRENLAALKELRKGVLTGSLPPVEAIGRYNDIISSLLSMERAVINTIDDSQLYTMINALHELSRAEDEIRIQRALVDAALPRSDFNPALSDALNDARARLDSRVRSFETVANAEPRQAREVVNSEEMERWMAAEDELMRAIRVEGVHTSLTLDQWNGLSDDLISRTVRVRSQLSEQFNERAYDLYDEASDRAGTTTVLMVTALILAAGVIFVIGRNLLGSLGQLRRGALEAANEQLPRAVARIRQGSDVETEVDAVPVETTEEVGQVARAFDEVNRQALRLASEQAALRRGYSESFVNVSRRSQSLLERQLRLFEELEQDEDDPDQLATLFRLDHLATRMRRNNENLMVLSGSDIARRFTQPVQLADVLRAAVSEIEHYPRVVVQSPPEARLVGYAGSDLVRLMAELLDNAANFSSPETSVTVSSRQSEDSSLTIDVLDHGIGMGERELAEANERLASFDEEDLSMSRRMGLLVVARLSGRHGITVRLHGGDDVDGVRATVHVPPDLVIPERGGSGTSRIPQHSVPAAPPPATGPSGSASVTPSGPSTAPAGPSQHRSSTVGQESAPHPHNNGSEQRADSSRVNGEHRRQVLQGGLAGFDLGAPPGDSDTRQTVHSPGDGEQRREQPTGPEHSPEIPVQQGTGSRSEPAPEQWPTEQPDEQVPAFPNLEPEGRVRGLFEPPEGQEYHETPEDAPDEGSLYFDGLAPEGRPEQRYSDSAPTVVQPIPPAPSGNSGAQWFAPAPENASYQAEGYRPDSEQWQWPSDEEAAAQVGDLPSGTPAAGADARGGQAPAGPAPHGGAGGYTDSGLPRRTPRAGLNGKSGAPSGTDGGAGASGGRGLSWMEEATQQSSNGAPSDGAPASPERGPAGTAGAAFGGGRTGSGLPRRDAGRSQHPGRADNGLFGAAPGNEGRQTPSSGKEDGTARSESPMDESAAWNFSTGRAHQDSAVSDPQPAEYTSAGLPRRVPKQHLAPGSAPPSGRSESTTTQNTPAPDETRGRLSSFQQGVRRGRHSAGE
ncbi:nitrate- and nitrite sensing domain-containing protein [Actinopolyspora mortivallis]|uniref:nitrate- and nitrite sensing domain-containing protein n=1 Tax=Actinopolyspora mortivallis TaxID=33906 RepID=UPI0021590DE8|nr:nitrate- and nitrite sensing domain-containing protein [Actinopolyspora mortivallis]